MKGQIVKILSNLYSVNSNNKLYECHSRGKFRKDNIKPVVGDYVVFDDKNNYILDILPRKNILIRPPVANIDQAIIVTSVKHPDFSSNLLDKLITLMEYNQINVILCFSKWDLLDEEETSEMINIVNYYNSIGYTTVKNTDIDKIKSLLKNKTSVFTGQTGAGKSTLMNKLDNNLRLETGEISESLGRGKHTTRHVELIEMFGGKVLDTPGFSALSFDDLNKNEIKNTFVEFGKYPCLYHDCMHTNESECKVKENVNNGNILKSRYDNYIKFISGGIK